MDRSPGPADEIPDELLGQALAGLAVAAGLGGDRGKALIVAELLEPIDGVVAGVVVGEDLGEEEPQGDPGGVDPLRQGWLQWRHAASTRVPREELEEGESVLLVELVADGIELVARGRAVDWATATSLVWYQVECVRTTRLPTKEVALVSGHAFK